jgi:hypothetical protein
MNDLRPQSSEYGRPIPIVYSVMAVGGNVIWATDLVKTGDGDGGGKGGGGGGGTGPTYAANFAILICEGSGDTVLGGSGRVRKSASSSTQHPEAGNRLTQVLRRRGRSAARPLMESHLGAGNVPAYRGSVYIVIENFDVSTHDGNRIPFLTIEVGQKDTSTPAARLPKTSASRSSTR